MKKALFCLMAVVAFAACNNEENPTNPNPPIDVDDATNAINIVVDNERLTSYQVVYSLIPEDKEAYYYCDVMSKARWESADFDAIRDEFNAALISYADMIDATYEEVCEQMLFKGDQLDFLSNAGYRGDTDFVIYAFYWTEEDLMRDDIFFTEFRTPSHVDSTESVAISFEGIDPYEMSVKCVPTDGVDEYYYYFDETTKVDAMLAQLEDENAYLSYQAMNVGIKYEGEQTLSHKGLKPETAYTAVVMAIDKKGYRMMTSAGESTEAVVQSERVESPLFESLLGEWTGVQTVTDGYSEPMVSEFTVTIASGVSDYDYDYRANNQLVALVDGWCDIAYYSVADLVEYEIEEPELKWGPKWVFDIAEGDVVTMDGYARHSVIGWMFFGDCFMLCADPVNLGVEVDNNFNVSVSEDGNTLTISSPVANYYPSLVYNFEGYGWMAYYYGASDIVLTRK
ncbi:MAG: hypothetical protein J6Q21_04880 [Alistipes sp.]|nr:hypothetical protein [Alistipes sp.]